MSIDILTGVPGAGKSYYAVHHIHQLCQSDGKFLVLHNIEGLTCQDHRVIAVDWKTEDFHAQLMADRLRQLRTEYGLASEDLIHLFIDEAQRFFPPELKDQQILYFFDYHRHFGVTVTLITQHEKKLTYKITTLAESEIRAVSQKINPLGSFVYKLSAGGEHYSTKRLPKEKQIFALYKSFQAGTGKTKKSNLRIIVVGVVVAAVLAWVVFFKVFAQSFAPSAKQSKAAVEVATLPDKSLSASRSTPPPPPNLDRPEKVEETVKEPEYLGPEILEYNKSQDTVRIKLPKSDFEGWIPVVQYIEDYPPQIYGYGYFHAPHRKIVLTSSLTKDIIYPVKNALASVQYLNPPSSNTPPAEYDPWPDMAYGRSKQSGGYSLEDERMKHRWQGITDAFSNHDRYSKPPIPTTLPKKEVVVPAAAPTSPGEHMQPGAQAGGK